MFSDETDATSQIAEYLSSPDLRALRLQNAKLAAAVVRPLFHSISAEFSLAGDVLGPNFNRKDRELAGYLHDVWHTSTRQERVNPTLHGGQLPLARLFNVASRPHLARYVKRLSVGFAHVDCPYCRCNGCLYGYDVCNEGPYHRTDCDFGREDLPIAGLRYIERLVRAVAFALPRLRNVEEMHLSSKWRHFMDVGTGSFASHLRMEMTRVTHQILTYFSHPTRRGRLRSWNHTASLMDDIAFYFQVPLLRNVLDNIRTLHLVIDCGAQHYNTDVASQALTADEERLNRLLKLAFNLHELSLVYYNHNPPHLRLRLKLIACLPLKRLGLVNFDEWRAPTESGLIHRYGDSFVVQHKLRDLSIVQAKLSSTWLLRLLRENAKSLCSVRLASIELIHGTWTEVFACLCDDTPRVTNIQFDGLCYDLEGESSHLAVHENDRIVADYHCYDLRSADLTEFGLLEILHSVVNERAKTSQTNVISSVRLRESEEQLPAFGPEKRRYTVLDRWLGLKAM